MKRVKGDDRNFPPLLLELRKQYPDEGFDAADSGTLYVGEKGVIFTGSSGDKMHIVPWEKMKATPVPGPTLPRIPKGIFNNFIETVRAGRTDTAVPFEYGTRLTEFAILGNLAARGRGQEGDVGWAEHEGHKHPRTQRLGETRVSQRLASLRKRRIAIET